MLSPPSAIMAKAWQRRGADNGRTLQRRQPRLRRRHITPNLCRRAIALVKNGDPITIDAEKAGVDARSASAELKRRKRREEAAPRYNCGVLAKYARKSPAPHSAR